MRRSFELVLALLAGGAFGFFSDSATMALLGALLGAGVWMGVDGMRAARALHWLQRPDPANQPALVGTWGELLYRVRRLIKKLEKKANNSDARLDDFLAALQASPNGVVLMDATGRIEWANQSASDHLGFHAQSDLGQHLRNLVRQPHFTAYLAAGDFAAPVELNGPVIPSGQVARISLLIRRYGKKRKLVLTRDITALQLAEAMRRDFVANVSHEIRTPLTVLSGFIETMQTLSLEERDRSRYLDLMGQQAQRMMSLVSDLLTLSRLEGSPLPGSNDWIEQAELLGHVVQEARGLSRTLAEPEHSVLTVEGPLGSVSGGKSELLSAMSNLLSNAVRYSPPGSEIRTGWRAGQGGEAVFFVQDSGPGIAAQDIPRLTERFFRVDRSRSRETGGTGLGLAIVKHVVQRHGGRLDIQSEPNSGACFEIVLPENRVRWG